SMKENIYAQLASLFFSTRQIIRSNLNARPDPNAWLRLETLRFIAENADPTMQSVAEYLHIKAPSATSLVSTLERAGWVKRTVSKADKRIVCIDVTAQGRKELGKYRAESRKVMQAVFSKLPQRDVETLKRILASVDEAHHG